MGTDCVCLANFSGVITQPNDTCTACPPGRYLPDPPGLSCPPLPCPPPPSPPPAPRLCVDKGRANLRLNGTMVFGRGVEAGASTSAGVAEGGHAAERYVWEAVTGNWAAESIVTQRECDVMGQSAESPQRRATAQCSSREGKIQFWKKAMYVAAINRTFLIHGNVMDGVPGRPHRCDTVPGSNTLLMLEAAELMFYMFGGVVAGSNGTSRLAA